MFNRYIYIYIICHSPPLSLSWDLCHVCFPWSIWCTPGPDCHQQWPPATLPREWPSCLRCWKSGNYQPLGPLGCWMAMDGPGTSKIILVARAPADPSGLWSRGVMSRMRHLNISSWIIMYLNHLSARPSARVCSSEARSSIRYLLIRVYLGIGARTSGNMSTLWGHNETMATYC